jgi:hypothetical protein
VVLEKLDLPGKRDGTLKEKVLPGNDSSFFRLRGAKRAKSTTMK